MNMSLRLRGAHNWRPSGSARTGGAVIIMVVSLMTTLVVLGLFFYSWTNQELANAEYFAAKDPLEIDPDAIFDHALQQGIVSVPSEFPNSALYGNFSGNNVTVWSLLAHQIGPIRPNGTPLNGGIADGGGATVSFIDNNNDGVPDDVFDLDNDATPDYPGFSIDYNGDGTNEYHTSSFPNGLRLNFSRLVGTTPADYLFHPDSSYTYPDINALFLAQDYTDYRDSTRIIKPSFALPGYFPEARRNGFTDFYKASGTANANGNQSLRPHETHEVQVTGNPNIERYVTSSAGPQSAQSGDRNRLIEPFPFEGGTWGKWESAGNNYELDRDLDGDGIDDSIAIDHDHPIMELPGGREVVPIYFWKIIDMDGLFNVNMHGNQADIVRRSTSGTVNIETDIYDADEWLNFSQFGMTPSEVNLSMGLYANPNDTKFLATNSKKHATLQHRSYVPSDPAANTFTRLKIANLETSMLMYGSPEFINHSGSVERRLKYPDDDRFDVMGRYGDDGNLRGTISGSGKLPVPGEPDVDENSDDSNGMTSNGALAKDNHERGGRVYNNTRIGVDVRPFVHPMDYTGMGDSSETTWQNYRRTDGTDIEDLAGTRFVGEVDSSKNSPVRWIKYPNEARWQEFGNLGDRILTTTLFPDTNSGDYLANDAAEFHMYGGLNTNGDAPFLPTEMAALHLSDADWQETRFDSRLRNLLPFNFEKNRLASQIRQQYTTDSWDRREFSFSLGLGSRSWEFNNNDKFPPDFLNDPNNPSEHELVDPENPADSTEGYDPNISPSDPFRPEVRRLLTVDLGAAVPDRSKFPQMRLQLNRILSDDVLSSASASTGTNTYDFTAFDESGNPTFRHIVPHPNFSSDQGTVEDMVHDNLTRTIVQGFGATHPIRRFDEIGSNAKVQEWWARYDRQRLCRDIYVLLYTLGNGDDSVNMSSATLANDADFDGDGTDDFNRFVRDCAQMAVNYVDAMDRDNVITKFEYDPNLSDGWSNAPTEVVYGVELQDLTFSEALLIDVANESNDSPHTLHQEGTNRHRFLYVELRNTSPFPVEFEEDSWRIVRLNAMSGELEMTAEIIPDGNRTLEVEAGENFLIGCHDGAVTNGNGDAIGSEFYINHDVPTAGDVELECLIPDNTTAASTRVKVSDNNQQPTESRFDLDMTSIASATPYPGRNHVRFGTASNGYSGSTLVEEISPASGGPATSPAGPSFYLSLQRRPHLKANGTGQTEWIEVDRIFVDVDDFDPADPTSQSDIAGEMDSEVESSERDYHFTRNTRDNNQSNSPKHTLDVTPAAMNTVETDHQANWWLRNSTPNKIEDADAIKLWQPHFDRDFSSISDLLSIPVYGWFRFDEANPLEPGNYNNVLHGGVVHNLVDDYRLTGHQTAQSRILFPNFNDIPTDHPWNSFAPSYQNRWFRLLNFVEIDPRADNAVDARLRLDRRIPGRINLNTMRHEHVLAGLIDDDIHHDAITNIESGLDNGMESGPTTDLTSGSRRWMNQLLSSRDSDPVLQAPNRGLPGTPFAQPFRGLAEINLADAGISLDGNVLRNGTSGDLQNAGLFEARPISDFNHPSGGDVDEDLIDYHTRHRLLAKVMNNTTTKSHVFGIWLGFDLHEAHTVTSGSSSATQIGARATDLPRYRMFCVVDMSRLEEAYNPVTGAFDFEKFIIHRQQLPD